MPKADVRPARRVERVITCSLLQKPTGLRILVETLSEHSRHPGYMSTGYPTSDISGSTALCCAALWSKREVKAWRTLGGWLTVGDPLVVEAVARAGFDVVGLDLQHGGFGLQEASRVLQVLDLVGVASIVRLSSEELGSMPRYLDFGRVRGDGCDGGRSETAERAIRLARYQPDGDRSEGGRRFGLVPDDRADPAAPRVWAMIETPAPDLESVDAIARRAGPARASRRAGGPRTGARRAWIGEAPACGLVRRRRARACRDPCAWARGMHVRGRWGRGGVVVRGRLRPRDPVQRSRPPARRHAPRDPGAAGGTAA